jgi:hypothetical protein
MNCNARADKDVRANPNPVFNHDRPRDQIKRRLRPIVTACAKKRTLRDINICTHPDFVEIQKPCFFPNPAVFTDRQFPGKRAFNAWFPDDRPPKISTKQLQNRAFNPVRFYKIDPKKDPLCTSPQELLPHRSTA